MVRPQRFLPASFTDTFDRAYRRLPREKQLAVDALIIALIKGEVTPGMRIKPILPSKFFSEARINDGDRLIHRTAEGQVWFVDIVEHDKINRYSRQREVG